jgi:hypothetical protein
MALGLTLPFTQEGEVTHVDPGLPRPIEKKFLKRNFLLFDLSGEGNLKQQGGTDSFVACLFIHPKLLSNKQFWPIHKNLIRLRKFHPFSL